MAILVGNNKRKNEPCEPDFQKIFFSLILKKRFKDLEKVLLFWEQVHGFSKENSMDLEKSSRAFAEGSKEWAGPFGASVFQAGKKKTEKFCGSDSNSWLPSR